MGKRGPAPKPTALRLLEGNPGKRAINKQEPRPPVRDPKMPQWLGRKARRLWRRLAPELQARAGMSDWDAEAFAVLCEAVEMYGAAVQDIHERGQILEETRTRYNRDGSVFSKETVRSKNPSVQIARDSAHTIRAYAQEFGMTPSARSGIKLPEVDAETAGAIMRPVRVRNAKP